jgi:hypothetical protein
LLISQGTLDPWSAGGALIEDKTARKNNIFFYNIDGAAHHLDLRVPNSCDPPSLFTSTIYQINYFQLLQTPAIKSLTF